LASKYDDFWRSQRPRPVARPVGRQQESDQHVRPDRIGGRRPAAVIDTSLDKGRVALLGTVAAGKTTTCRYLARSWAAAGEDSHCVVLTLRERVHEHADLHNSSVHVVTALETAAQPWRTAGLLIVDDAEPHDPTTLIRALNSPVNTVIVASFGPAVEQTHKSFTGIYALRRKQHPARSDPVQGRLDWPSAVDVFLDPRDRADFPQHKWAIGAHAGDRRPSAAAPARPAS
jgi:hypothetical protein